MHHYYMSPRQQGKTWAMQNFIDFKLREQILDNYLEEVLTEPSPCTLGEVNFSRMENHGTGWIGVDLNGALAEYNGFKGLEHIGKPIPLMLERVRRWLAEGREVRIFTARASDPGAFKYIHEWLITECKLPPLKITNVKDPEMDELWDDRIVSVIPNTGLPSNKSPRGLD